MSFCDLLFVMETLLRLSSSHPLLSLVILFLFVCHVRFIYVGRGKGFSRTSSGYGGDFFVTLPHPSLPSPSLILPFPNPPSIPLPTHFTQPPRYSKMSPPPPPNPKLELFILPGALYTRRVLIHLLKKAYLFQAQLQMPMGEN
jgi:hypothetical protein